MLVKRTERPKEWYEAQIAAGHDIKHISDVLRITKSEIEMELNYFGIKWKKTEKNPRKILTFDDIVDYDTVAHKGILYTVTKKNKASIIIKNQEKPIRAIKITAKQWEQDGWKVKRDYGAPVCYNIKDIPEGERMLLDYEKKVSNGIDMKRSLAYALIGLKS